MEKQNCCIGALCVGYAAHAMSPIGGVGVNLAIQDAIAAAHPHSCARFRGRVCCRSSRRG
jgi:2-polyprenyl-6-methoxyphenol hydroxylase-like FAD-dependent oxidoreductase